MTDAGLGAVAFIDPPPRCSPKGGDVHVPAMHLHAKQRYRPHGT